MLARTACRQAGAVRRVQPVAQRSYGRVAVAPVFPEGSIYTREPGSNTLRLVHFNPDERKTGKENPTFRRYLNELFVRHRPSKHQFFAELAGAPASVVKNTGWLNEFYTRYQACMHATRCAVYFTPHLNVATLRQRKLEILSDDDAIIKKSHHRQLEEMFRSFGAEPKPEEFFGDLDELAKEVDPSTAAFIKTSDRLYRQSTGAWTIAEVLSDDWLSALANSLAVHHPHAPKADYFDEVLTGHVEVLHMMETVSLTEEILAKRPHLLRPTLEHAAEMSHTLDGLWTSLGHLTRYPEQFLSKK